MKYQIRNSSVQFTNKTVNSSSVTSYEWYMDSGSGFTLISTEQDPMITFPDEAGLLCRVKLVCNGVWGDVVDFIDEYTTVENIEPPEIVSETITRSLFSDIDYQPQMVVGKPGAGILTWEVFSDKDIEINSLTGHVSGLIVSKLSNSFSLKVTDSLGRTDTKTINVTNSSNISNIQFITLSDLTITKDLDNKVSEIKNSDGVTFWSQPDPLLQPTYIPDDGFGFPCIEFNGNQNMTSPIVWQAGSIWGGSQSFGFCGRLKSMTRATVSSSIMGFSGSYAKSGTIKVGGFQMGSEMDFIGLDFDLIILSQPIDSGRVTTRFNGVSMSPTIVDGFYCLNFATGGTTYASIGANQTFPSANFRIYDHVFWGDGYATNPAIPATSINNLNQYYAKKYGIKCKRIE